MLIRYSSDKNGKPHKKAVIYTKTEHSITKDKIDTDALRVITQLRDYGFEAYIVGGAVRDLLLGRVPKDFDIVTNATPSKIKKFFRNSRIIGRRFRLVHIFFGPKIFEVSTFRSLCDGSIGNSFGTMDEDVQRRDFTLNALYYDPIKEQIIDYVGGFKDIKKRLITPVIPLDRIFTEDPVRMIRAVKYAASTGFALPFFLKRKIRKNAHLLSPISPSRLTEEFLKIINSGHAFDITSLALETDLYMYLQPSATALMFDNSAFEQDYLTRLRELDALIVISPDARLGQKLSYLIQDFVKQLTNWEQEVINSTSAGELYIKTWSQCRHFVLPINPQRSELEFAIKTTLKKMGVALKIPKKSTKDFFTEAKVALEQKKNSELVKKKKRRPKKKKPNAQAPISYQ
ncbi:MAG TPA: polynucleotide adenylyltransferase PcnB [Treponemataceae bacterium]|nr:polynucleotide adenylyltransferase PcnB [Treponemataceae bacterium]